ncbi:MAG: peptidylprolyl isomerase [Planctomycetaceae bacterium]|nr:peptidylprolyl isomerase [Planctomycetaceae bacterium]
MLSVTVGPLLTNDLPTSKDELIAVPIANSTANPVTVSVQSSNSNVTADVVSGGRSLTLNVSGKDSGGVAFTGNITFRLFESTDPVTTGRIIQLANSGFYNGLLFHRVIDGFVAQGGDPSGDGSGGSGTKFDDEFSSGLTFTSNGLLAMANSGDDTNDSQFFITDVDETLAQLPQHLNFQHSIFGILTSGADVFRKIMGTPTNATTDKPLTNVVINTATVFTDPNNAVIRLHSASGFTGSTTLTVTADDGQGSTDQEQATINVVTDTVNDRAFLGPVTNQSTNQGTPVTFTVQGFDLEKDSLKFVVWDANSFSTDASTGSLPANVNVSIQVNPASGNTPALASITLTPKGTFTGTVNLIVGVRDGVARGASGTTLESRTNFDTQKITLTVNLVNHSPTTPGGSTSTLLNQAASIQLTGDDGDSDKMQTLTFELLELPTQPGHGTLSNFDAATGALQYTPNVGYTGPDSFTYFVRDNGGTANGGNDASNAATFSLTIVPIIPPVPTGLAMASASDDGLFNDDRVTSNSAPTFTLSAQSGSTVRFLVNGTAHVNTTETSPGQFSGKLTRAMLRVGDNKITATSEANGLTSDSTADLAFTYTPNDDEIYTVPGDFDSSQQVTFHWSSWYRRFRGEIGVFKVDDLQGHINGLAPGDDGYAAAAMASRQVLFSRGSGTNATKTLDVHGGELLSFYFTANNSAAHFADHNQQYRFGGRSILFSIPEANRGDVDHLRTTADTRTGEMVMHWDAGWFGWRRGFSNAVITVTPGTTAGAGSSEALRITGSSDHTVPVTFTLESSKDSPFSHESTSNQSAHGELGLFVVDDSSGSIGGIAPGDPGYLQAVLNSSTRQVIFSQGDAAATQKTISLTGGVLIGWYYIPNGTAAEVLANNPDNSANGSPVALFSFDDANSAAIRNTHWFSRNRGAISLVPDYGDSDLQLHVLDRLFGNSRHFDDLLVGITGNG